MSQLTRARCPGHITGFFEIVKKADARHTGSRGAGVCISKGVETSVTAIKNPIKKENECVIKINGELSTAPVTRSVVNQFFSLLKDTYSLTVEHFLEVPIGAGFGASGAGALSTAVALNTEFGLHFPRNKVATIAHIAEVENKTGLGDVIAQTFGGIEIRIEPGAPGIGRIDRIISADGPIKPNNFVVLCVSRGPIETKAILSNAMQAERINLAGKNMVEELLKHATVEQLLRLSRKFMEESGLASEKVKELLVYIDDLTKNGLPASVQALGKSVFAFVERVKSTELLDEVRAYSPDLNAFICDVDYQGPRLVEVPNEA
ncbi:MAG: GHMP kinase [Candidatus Helarchaeota archaeon]|nr:GHMP kinase [Candidatus Helarchaeota archaeon]